MRYILETTNEVVQDVKSGRIKKIHEKIEKIRMSEKMGVKFMQRWEELEYARQDGITEGIELLLSTCYDLGISRETTLTKLKDKLQLTDIKAEEYMKQFWGK